MNILVVKFGGSCLATPEKIKKRAELIKAYCEQGHSVIVVVSAMGHQTNELVKLAYQVSPAPHRRELDMLLTTGERVSMALMSMVLNDLGCPAISFTGSQAGILTEEEHNNAKIKELKPIRVEEELKKGKVVIIAGFQGVNPQSKEITTLGRGGSDTTALAIAKFFEGTCYIFKDVLGVCTADPLVFKGAKTFSHLSHKQLIEMCCSGSQVMHLRAAEYAREWLIDYYIVSAEHPTIQTKISNTPYDYFKAIALANNVTLVKTILNFEVWINDHGLIVPQIFYHENRTYFWGDLEIIKPIHMRMQENGIEIQKGLSFISVWDSHSSPKRIFCKDEDCKKELIKLQEMNFST